MPKAKDTTFEQIGIGLRNGAPEAMELRDSFGQMSLLTLHEVREEPGAARQPVQVHAAQGRRRVRAVNADRRVRAAWLTCSTPSRASAAGRGAAPAHDRRGDRPEPSARAGQAAAPGLRVRQAAFDDPVGPAGRRQDHAGAADGRRLRLRIHRAVGGARRASRTSARRSSRREQHLASTASTPSCSSTKSIASTSRSRTRCCPSSNRAW